MAREVSKVDQDLIPIFDGDRITLKSYINACEFLIEEYIPNFNPAIANEARMARRLLMIFMGRLRAKAREAVDANKTPTSWPELKNILIHSFGDKRSEDVLVYDLNSLVPKRDDNTASYANKIKSTLYTLLSKINLEEEDAAIRDLKQDQYNQIALRTYLFGLDLINPQIGMEVKLRDPDDIETAEAYALEVTNYNMQKQRFLANFRHQQPTTPTRPIITPPHRVPNKPTQQIQRYQSPNLQPNKYIPPAQMPPRIMYHPRPQYQPQYTYQQPHYQQQPQFGRSHGNYQERPYKPTPMDISGVNKRPPTSSLQKPPAKRQWVSNNIELSQTEEPEEYNSYPEQNEPEEPYFEEYLVTEEDNYADDEQPSTSQNFQMDQTQNLPT